MVPLVARGRPLGGIAIFTEEIRDFDPEEVELAQAFGHQAALTVQNAETLARERQAGRLEHLLQRSDSLSPDDRRQVEQLLEVAERIIELGTHSHRPRVRRVQDDQT
jgi:GAF domain-containing protein